MFAGSGRVGRVGLDCDEGDASLGIISGKLHETPIAHLRCGAMVRHEGNHHHLGILEAGGAIHLVVDPLQRERGHRRSSLEHGMGGLTRPDRAIIVESELKSLGSFLSKQAFSSALILS